MLEQPLHKKSSFPFTEEILNGKFHFLCSEVNVNLFLPRISDFSRGIKKEHREKMIY